MVNHKEKKRWNQSSKYKILIMMIGYNKKLKLSNLCGATRVHILHSTNWYSNCFRISLSLL